MLHCTQKNQKTITQAGWAAVVPLVSALGKRKTLGLHYVKQHQDKIKLSFPVFIALTTIASVLGS